MSFGNFVLGKPLATSDERAEQIGPVAGIPIFGLDALSSAGYGPEAAMTLLIPLGVLGLHYIVPISASIIVLLLVVYFSYLQTIAAYPGGGGSYTVARENLGEFAGLLAASALMIDYVLVVAVGISAGVGALISAVPSLHPHTLALCLVILLIIALINLRGVREAGTVFMFPTYLFVGTLFITLGIGLVRAVLSDFHPAAVVAPPHVPSPLRAVGGWLLLQAFASGCTAMTGVEAVSNGVKAFREPAVKAARTTLTVIIGVLVVLLAGIAYLVKTYNIAATDPGQIGYESVLSQLVGAVAGKGVFYYVAMMSILLVLALSANTAFADFPRLCQAIAHNGFLPRSFASRGRRLVYSQGIYVLAFLAALLLVIFGGVTDRLIPLFAVGAFLAFTLSQAGMVAHWRRVGGPGALRSIAVNGLGAVATGITVMVVLVAKFVQGAWITLALIPGLFLLMRAVRRQYEYVGAELATNAPLDLSQLGPPLVIVPVITWNKVAQKALRFALKLSTNVQAVHVATEDDDCDLRELWPAKVEVPTRAAGFTPPRLVILNSPFRYVLTPVLKHILEASREIPGRQVAVLIPEMIENRWYNYMLHNQRAAILTAMLFVWGNPGIIVINVPWYLSTPERPAPQPPAPPTVLQP